MVADEVIGALIEAIAIGVFDIFTPSGSRRQAGKQREETRTLLHAAANDKLDSKQEERLRALLRQQGYRVEGVTHDELLRIARKSEERAIKAGAKIDT